jgi:hypothetical protein
MRATIAGEASARGERARELGKQDRVRIDADFKHHRERAKSSPQR